MGVSIPSDECRRGRLWKVSSYPKIAFANSTRVRQRCRSSSSTCIRLQKRLDDRVVVAIADRSHRWDESRIDGALGESPRRKSRALIGVNHGPVRRSALLIAMSSACVTSGAGLARVNRPSDHASREDVEDDRAIGLAFAVGCSVMSVTRADRARRVRSCIRRDRRRSRSAESAAIGDVL
jgi:hypothetical protein